MLRQWAGSKYLEASKAALEEKVLVAETLYSAQAAMLMEYPGAVASLQEAIVSS